VPRLRYESEGFPAFMGVAFRQPSNLDFTWAELCKCAITVGRANWVDVMQNGRFSFFELTWRIAMLWANLQEDATGSLRPSDAFKRLDRSEKGAISYFLGMCFTKLLLEKLFGVPWLLHFDVYRNSLNGYLASNRRPDFVGLDARQQWAVVEAKGRSWSMPDYTMAAAKQQTRSLRNIDGQLPSLRTAVGVYFKGGIAARIWDPDEYDDEAEDQPIDPDQFLRLYYEPLIVRTGLLQSRTRTQSSTQKLRRGVELEGLDATLLVDNDIIDAFQRERPLWHSVMATRLGGADSILAEIASLRAHLVAESRDEGRELLSQLIDKRRSMDIGQAADGVTVELGQSWSPGNMQRDPKDRGR